MDGRLDYATVEAGDDLAHILAGTHVAAVDLDLAAEQQAQVQLRPQAAGGSADAVAAAGTQGAEAVGPYVSAHVVHQQVNTGSAGDLAHPLGDVLLVVVDDVVRAQAAGQFGLFRRAGGGDHRRAHHVLEHLDRRRAHAG